MHRDSGRKISDPFRRIESAEPPGDSAKGKHDRCVSQACGTENPPGQRRRRERMEHIGSKLSNLIRYAAYRSKADFPSTSDALIIHLRLPVHNPGRLAPRALSRIAGQDIVTAPIQLSHKRIWSMEQHDPHGIASSRRGSWRTGSSGAVRGNLIDRQEQHLRQQLRALSGRERVFVVGPCASDLDGLNHTNSAWRRRSETESICHSRDR